MPGPASDSYDPEFGTGANAHAVFDALDEVERAVSGVLGDRPPVNVVQLAKGGYPAAIAAALTERQWRLIRFALGRARESL